MSLSATAMLMRASGGVRRPGPGHLEVHHVVADGDLVVVARRSMHVFRVVDGRAREHWATRDDLGLLRTLGAWRPGGTTGL